MATFLLGEGTFGLDTALIQEVVMMGEVTPVHHAPELCGRHSQSARPNHHRHRFAGAVGVAAVDAVRRAAS